MRATSLFLVILVTAFLQIHVLGDRRLGGSLQDANSDFLNIEGNRKPTPTQPNPNAATGGIKATPTTPSSPTGTKQLIKEFNDKIAENQGNGNRNNPSRQNSQGNRESFPSLPNKNQNRQSGQSNSGTTSTSGSQGTTNPTGFNSQWGPQSNGNNPSRQNSQGNREGFPSWTNQNQSRQSGPWNSQNNPSGSNAPSGTTNSPGSNNQWGPQDRNRNRDFPGLPNSGSSTAQPSTPKSWSSVVSNNNKPSGPQPTGLSFKSSATLKPIVPGAPLPPVEATTPIVEVISDSELKTLSENLFKKDSNNAAKFVTVNYQGRTSSFSKDDLAPQPLLSIQQAAWDLPTIAAMKSLLDNYEQDTTVNEYVTAQERNEENVFLDAVMATPVIRHLMSELKEKKLVSPDPKEQKDVLKSIWFNMYSRGQGRIGSSGFEHIFLSELKNGEISGLHNWLYFATQEDAKNANYLGYLKKLDIGDKQAILKLHFNMKGIDKPVDTMFVGTTPELEMALYSLCFLTRADRSCPLSLGGKDFNLRTHTFRYRSKDMIGSAFPEI